MRERRPIEIAVVDPDGSSVNTVFFSEDPRCSVGSDRIIRVNPQLEGGDYPVFLQFTALRPISGLCFAKNKKDLKKCFSRQGPCGGCFSLETPIKVPSPQTPLIRNDGKDAKGVTEYHFELCFEDGSRTSIIDPQIYNQGIGEYPAWRRWLQRWWKRPGPVPWWRRLFSSKG